MTTTMTRFPLEELVRLPSFYLPAPSWDGRQVAYYSDRSGRIELWVLDIESGMSRQTSQGQLPRALHAGFAWNRAGDAIVYPRDADGDEQHNLWLLDLATGQAQQLTDTPGMQEIPVEFSPDDGWVSFLSTRDGQLNLYKMRRDGSDATALTSFANPVWGFGGQWSPDGKLLVACANESRNLQNMDVYVVPADGGQPRKIFSSGDGTKDRVTDWSPDGRFLALSSDASGVSRAGILDVNTGAAVWFGEEGVEETAHSFSPDGRLLLALRNRDARLQAVVYDVETGAGRSLDLPAGNAIPAGFALDGRAVVLAHSSDAQRPALLLYDLASGAVRTLIEPEYGSIDPRVFAASDDIYYESFDGLRIHALLYRPHDIPAGTRVPAVVIPHGGPTAQYFHMFDPYVQFLVNEGYVVLEPNVRGSTGYGVAFRDMALQDWGGADLKDIVAGRQYLADLSYVDGDRVGIFGGSYGGFMTYTAITKAPEEWRAAVAWVGVTELQAMYDESMPHFKYFLRNQMGDPEENAELWAERSAANYADRVQAKLLIVHGVNDPRCPISQARIFRDRLLAAGKIEGRDFEYVELGAEGHGSTDQDQRLRAFRLLADFFSRNL